MWQAIGYVEHYGVRGGTYTQTVVLCRNCRNSKSQTLFQICCNVVRIQLPFEIYHCMIWIRGRRRCNCYCRHMVVWLWIEWRVVGSWWHDAIRPRWPKSFHFGISSSLCVKMSALWQVYNSRRFVSDWLVVLKHWSVLLRFSLRIWMKSKWPAETIFFLQGFETCCSATKWLYPHEWKVRRNFERSSCRMQPQSCSAWGSWRASCHSVGTIQ